MQNLTFFGAEISSRTAGTAAGQMATAMSDVQAPPAAFRNDAPASHNPTQTPDHSAHHIANNSPLNYFTLLAMVLMLLWPAMVHTLFADFVAIELAFLHSLPLEHISDSQKLQTATFFSQQSTMVLFIKHQGLLALLLCSKMLFLLVVTKSFSLYGTHYVAGTTLARAICVAMLPSLFYSLVLGFYLMTLPLQQLYHFYDVASWNQLLWQLPEQAPHAALVRLESPLQWFGFLLLWAWVKQQALPQRLTAFVVASYLLFVALMWVGGL